MNLSKTRLVIVGAEQAGRGAAKALRASQPITATRNMAPEANEYEAPPWFWSDPHDAGIQIVCHPGGGGEIVRGDITNAKRHGESPFWLKTHAGADSSHR